MDVEGLRRQLAEEIKSQYEGRLREAKRQKSSAEEELESASERWRTERRRLNTEIDRLENALADAKSPARQKGAADSRSGGVAAEELAKLQQAAEEKLKKATAEWQGERERLVTENSRLERAVAEAIERSSNPIRSTQAIRDQFEAKLNDASKQRLEVEQELLRSKAVWDEEKKKLMGEIIKLRRLAPSKAFEVKEKIERMHGRVESFEEVRIHELEDQLAEARSEVRKYHETAARAQDELTTATKEIQLLQQSASGEKAPPKVAQLRQEYDAKLLEAARQKDDADRRIRDLETQLANSRSEVQTYQDSTTKAQDQLTAANEEMQSLQRTLSETRDKVSAEVVDELRQQYDSKIQDLTRQKANEDARLQELESELANSRSEVQTYQESTIEAQDQAAAANKEIETLRLSVSEAQDQAGQKSHEIERIRDVEAQLAEARSELQKHKEAAGAAGEQLAAANKEIELLQRTLSETSQQVNADVVEQLRRQYDSKIQDMIGQKTQLASQLESATTTLESERSRFAGEFSKSKPEGAFDANGLESEVKRIAEQIQALESLIDDPKTDLSMVIRKNVEKAELDAYLRGILFSLGRAKGL